MKTKIVLFYCLLSISCHAQPFTIYADQNHLVTFDLNWPTNVAVGVSNALYTALIASTNAATLTVTLAGSFDSAGAASSAVSAATNATRLAAILSGSFDALGAAANATNTARLVINLGGTTLNI